MVDDATATMIANLPQRTGRSLDEWLTLLAPLGLSKHGEITSYLKTTHGVSHGFANDDDLMATLRLAYERA